MAEDQSTPEQKSDMNQAPDDVPALSDFDVAWLHEAVSKLAGFLQNPKSLSEAIQEKVDAGALESSWKELIEFLPKSGSYLSTKEERGRWLVDMGEAPSHKIRLNKMVSFAAEVEPQPQAPIPDLSADIERIRAVDGEIRAATEERLSLSRFATELRLIDLSPPYEAFDECASNLMTYRGAPNEQAQMPSLAADIAAVNQYIQNLDRAAGAIQKSIYLAALLAERDLEGGYTPRSFSRAMQVISAELDFASAGVQEIEENLNQLGLVFRDSFPAQMEIFTRFTNLRERELNSAAVVATIAEARVDDKALPSLPPDSVKYYYRDRAYALILHQRSGKPLRPISLEGLRLRFNNAVPGFHGNPDEMLLNTYATVVSRGIEDAAVEFVLVVLSKLGFVVYVQSALRNRMNDEQLDKELVRDIYEQASIAEKRDTALIVARDSAGPDEWEPSKRYATLLLFMEDLEGGLLWRCEKLMGSVPAFNFLVIPRFGPPLKSGLEPLQKTSLLHVRRYADETSVDYVIDHGGELLPGATPA